MRKSIKTAGILLAALCCFAGIACGSGRKKAEVPSPGVRNAETVRLDSVPAVDDKSRYDHLTEEDFRIVAEELGVEVAAMKAVVVIEAGSAMRGFSAPGVPVINFVR